MDIIPCLHQHSQMMTLKSSISPDTYTRILQAHRDTPAVHGNNFTKVLHLHIRAATFSRHVQTGHTKTCTYHTKPQLAQKSLLDLPKRPPYLDLVADKTHSTGSDQQKPHLRCVRSGASCHQISEVFRFHCGSNQVRRGLKRKREVNAVKSIRMGTK